MEKYRIKVVQLNSGIKSYEVERRDISSEAISLIKSSLFWMFLPLMIVLVPMFIFDYENIGVCDSLESAKNLIKGSKKRYETKRLEKAAEKRNVKLCKINKVSYIKIK